MNAGGAISGPDQIVRDILHGLAEGRYVPGQRLAEPDLMRRYGVARSTVREALRRLAAEGVAVIAPHRRARLRLLTRREAADLLRVLERLLGLAARQAAEAVAAGADPTAFAEAAAAFVARDGDAAARGRYYRALTRLAGNRDLSRLLASMQVHLIRAQLRLARPRGLADHRALAAAVVAGAPDRAEAAAARHVRRLIAALPAMPDSAFAPAGDDVTNPSRLPRLAV
jgi:DNA-binding GntR family transcriptional regulator